MEVADQRVPPLLPVRDAQYENCLILSSSFVLTWLPQPTERNHWAMEQVAQRLHLVQEVQHGAATFKVPWWR